MPEPKSRTDGVSDAGPRRFELRLWYAACVLLGIPWWMFAGIPLSAYALGYFWIWAVSIVATWRLQWGVHRWAGIGLAVVMNVAIWAAVVVSLLARHGDDPRFL